MGLPCLLFLCLWIRGPPCWELSFPLPLLLQPRAEVSPRYLRAIHTNPEMHAVWRWSLGLTLVWFFFTEHNMWCVLVTPGPPSPHPTVRGFWHVDSKIGTTVKPDLWHLHHLAPSRDALLMFEFMQLSQDLSRGLFSIFRFDIHRCYVSRGLSIVFLWVGGKPTSLSSMVQHKQYGDF